MLSKNPVKGRGFLLKQNLILTVKNKSMEHLNEIERQLRLHSNFQKALVLAFVIVSLLGSVATYYEMKSFDRHQNIEIQITHSN